jgi:hypothetical protein
MRRQCRTTSRNRSTSLPHRPTLHDRAVEPAQEPTILAAAPDAGRARSPTKLTAGKIAWRNGDTHISQTVGDTDLGLLAIEPK